MQPDDSILNGAAMGRARALLAKPRRIARTWPALAAAGALAVSALAFATVMIVAPPVKTDHVAASAPD
jgi:hypothetical protein